MADRLLFIRRFREAEETGELPNPLTLAEIRDVFERTAPEIIAAVAAGDLPLDAVAAAPAAPAEDLNGLIPAGWANHVNESGDGPPGMASRAARLGLMLDQTDDPDLFVPSPRSDSRARASRFSAQSGPPPGYLERAMARIGSSADDGLLGCREAGPEDEPASLAELLRHLDRATARPHHGRGRSESWTHAVITPGLNLSGCELDEDDRSTLEKAARALGDLIAGNRR
jgi:hypothetical protein